MSQLPCRAGAALATVAIAALVLPASALAHGDKVPTSELGGAWSAPPAVVAPAFLALLLFAQAWLRLRRRGRADHAPVWRLAAFCAGLALAVLALVSPIDAIGEEYLLSVHMLQHVLIGDAAAALILLSLTGPLVFFLLPAPVLGPLARLTPLRRLVTTLARPGIALTVWAGAVATWHVPALYEAALRTQWVHDVEHVTFVVAGLLLWFQLLDPARRGALTRGGRVGLAVIVFASGQVLSSVLLFSGRVLYGTYALQDERLLDLSPLTDQRLAGAVMMVEQAVTLGLLMMALLLAADDEARARPIVPAPRP